MLEGLSYLQWEQIHRWHFKHSSLPPGFLFLQLGQSQVWASDAYHAASLDNTSGEYCPRHVPQVTYSPNGSPDPSEMKYTWKYLDTRIKEYSLC